MRDPVYTRHRILHESGALFNTQGYKATSISDITTSTGLTKGAIYKHFRNKDDLEKETLVYLSQQMFEKIRRVVKAEPTANKKLRAVFRYFESYITDPPLKGGCPLLNVAVEADDVNPVLRNEALHILSVLKDSIVSILQNGIKRKQVKSDIDTEQYATLIIASLEGAIMMGKLEGDNSSIRRVIKHLDQWLSVIEL